VTLQLSGLAGEPGGTLDGVAVRVAVNAGTHATQAQSRAGLLAALIWEDLRHGFVDRLIHLGSPDRSGAPWGRNPLTIYQRGPSNNASDLVNSAAIHIFLGEDPPAPVTIEVASLDGERVASEEVAAPGSWRRVPTGSRSQSVAHSTRGESPCERTRIYRREVETAAI